MACINLELHGLDAGCVASKGGIKRVAIANRADGAPFAVQMTTDVNPTYEKITGFTTAYTSATMVDIWHTFNFKPNTAHMEGERTIDPANGVNFVTNTLYIQAGAMGTTARLEFEALSVNDLVVIFEDSNGKYFGLGLEEAVTASSANSQTGTARTDGNFYSINLVDYCSTFAVEMVESEAKKAFGEGI